MAYEKSNKLHIVSVVAVIRNEEGKYLVLKRRDDEVAYPRMYTFPGGKVEGNDTVEETLAKEVLEEAGLILKPGKILLKDKSFSYLCDVEKKEPVVISSDFTDYKWVNSEELKRLPHVGIEEELQKANELYKLPFPLSALYIKSVKEDLT